MSSVAAPSATVRVYRRLLIALLPDGFTDAFADEMIGVFAKLDAETRRNRSSFAAWLVLVAELPGLVRIALSERRTHRTIRPNTPRPSWRRICSTPS
ncbi:MAG TPA: hypothetical protein VGM50_14965 [Gemmatimonadaceae bacterium]|jgi:hypothetical protein